MASGILWPGIACGTPPFVYLPRRAPSALAPMSPAEPAVKPRRPKLIGSNRPNAAANSAPTRTASGNSRPESSTLITQKAAKRIRPITAAANTQVMSDASSAVKSSEQTEGSASNARYRPAKRKQGMPMQKPVSAFIITLPVFLALAKPASVAM